ncbi:hypothetical protein [Actinoplanes sp. NPDC020271]|uniref:hypothetical protein n=1 Tax=Actinoplanes sp. NPDC020271 TaxID=3363896 RepID=UPI0037B83B8C
MTGAWSQPAMPLLRAARELSGAGAVARRRVRSGTVSTAAPAPPSQDGAAGHDRVVGDDHRRQADPAEDRAG